MKPFLLFSYYVLTGTFAVIGVYAAIVGDYQLGALSWNLVALLQGLYIQFSPKSP